MHDRHSLHNSRRVFLRWLAGQGLTGVFPRLPVGIPRTAEVSQIEQGRTTHASKTAITLFLCGDVMTGRGIDQVLPHPGDPRLHEPYVGEVMPADMCNWRKRQADRSARRWISPTSGVTLLWNWNAGIRISV